MSKVFTTVLILLLSLNACGNRTTSVYDKNSSTAPDTETHTQAPGEVPAGQVALSRQDHHPEPESQAPITMSPVQNAPSATTPGTGSPPSDSSSLVSQTEPKASPPSAGTPGSKPSLVQPSRSLGGHDRFLVTRPFDSVRAADFELGLLFDRLADPTLANILDGLSRALTEKKFEVAGFNSQALLLAELLYAQDLASAPALIRIRYSAARSMPGAAYTLGIRLFSETGSALGLAILGNDEEQKWVINHLDLDLNELGKQQQRPSLWDPYGYSRNLFD